MIYNEIVDALNTAVETTVIVNQKDNEHYEPSLLDSWVRTTFLPAETENLTRGDNPRVRINGLFQIDVVTPAGAGQSASSTTASELVDYFYANRMIDTVSFDKVRIMNTWRSVSIQDGDWYITPVTLRWEQYHLT